jgi:hypothetical protein
VASATNSAQSERSVTPSASSRQTMHIYCAGALAFSTSSKSPDQLGTDWRIHLTVTRGLTSIAARNAAAPLTSALPIVCAVDTMLLAQVRNNEMTTQPL